MLFSLRIGSYDHLHPEYLAQLTAELQECGKVFDEVWLATSYGLPSLEECERHSEYLKKAAEEFEKIGILPSVQISRTMGHGDNTLRLNGGDGIKDLPVDKVTSINGDVSVAQFCWNNPAFRQYNVEAMKRYMKFQPAIIWIDDDMRLSNMGKSKYLCFCPNCIRLFNEEHGYSYTRETLKKDFLESRKIREEYIAFHVKGLGEFCRMIVEGVHEVSPDSVFALQNGGGIGYRTRGQHACLEAMKDVTGKAPGFRAGGGFYDDHNPNGMLDKAILLNYITSRLPEYVKMRSTEIENLPFVTYGKSVEGTCLEAALYMAYGHNMASVTLMNRSEPLEFHKRIFQKIAQYRPYLESLVEHSQNTKTGGLAIYQSEKSYLAQIGTEYENTWNGQVLFEPQKMYRSGIPMHAEPTGTAYLLSARSCSLLLEEDFEYLLHQPVIVDGAGIEKLIEAGFGSKLGITAHRIPDDLQYGVYEKTYDHPINDGISLTRWRDSYFSTREPQYYLEGEHLERVAEYYSAVGDKPVGCAIAVITTPYGAKWLVKGAHLFNGIVSFERKKQILQGINYISPAPIPAYVNSRDQVAVVPRVTEEGKTVVVTLLNVSISDAEDFEVVIENPTRTDFCTIADPYAGETTVPLTCKDGHYSVTVPHLAPWRVVSIFC